VLFTQLWIVFAEHCVPVVHSTQAPPEQMGIVPEHVVWFCHMLLTQLCTVLPVVVH
jgi:hypothetical protein